jgi:hypothetical protein
MLERQRAGKAGNRKHGDGTIRAFRRRIASGEVMARVARDLKISSSTASQIKGGHSYTHVIILILMALGTMGNACKRNNYNVSCQGLNYPMCRDVPFDYPCLCLEPPDGISRVQAQEMRHLND